MGQYASSREQVVATCRALLERGYLKATEGNVSVRVPGEEAFAVTPSSYDYAKMRADDIVVLDFEQKRLEGTLKASIEAGMHAAVYRERPDVNAIVHTHQPYASALALVRRPIPALFDEQVRFLGRSVEIIDYAPRGPPSSRRTSGGRSPAAPTPSSSPTTACWCWAATRSARCSTWRCSRRSRSTTCWR